MKPPMKALELLLVWVISLMIPGCQGSRVVVTDQPTAVYEKHGPPPWAPAHGYRAKHHYRYYPSSEIYFDIERNLYFYYEGGRWSVSASLPTGIHIDVDDYVSLEMETARPYEFHSEVVRKYPPGHQKRGFKGEGKGKWN